MKRNYTIELLRFLFALIVLGYHFYDFYLKEHSAHAYFSNGYIGDEFFFVVSGYFIAASAFKLKQAGEPTSIARTSLHYVIKRIRGLAYPYYISWAFAFIGLNLLPPLPLGTILRNLAGSVFDLTFLDLVGFGQAYHSSGVSWFVSGMLLSILVFYPWLLKYKEGYIYYVAPVISLIMYALLGLNYDRLYAPHTVFNGLLYKGLIRSFAGINLGVFVYGLSRLSSLQQLLRRRKTVATITQFACLCLVLGYATVTGVQLDYPVTIIIATALIITFSTTTYLEDALAGKKLVKHAGRASVYIYFSQAIVYTKKDFVLSLGDTVIA